jgi:hypothetical protein
LLLEYGGKIKVVKADLKRLSQNNFVHKFLKIFVNPSNPGSERELRL